MRKFTLLFIAVAFALSTYAQKDAQVSEKMFQINSKIQNSNFVNSSKTNNAVYNTNKVNILDESFEGTTFPPTGWTKQNGTTNASYQWKEGTTAHTGSKGAMVEYDPALVPQNEWLISPTLNLSTLTVPVLEFWWSMSYYWGTSPNNNYDFRVKVSTNGGSSWQTVWTEDSVPNYPNFTLTKASINLSSFVSATNFKVAFQYQGTDGAALYVDDIVIGNLIPHRLDFQEIWSGFVTFDAPFDWSGYSQIPFGQSFPASFAADIKSTGSATQNNVKLTVKELTSGTSLSSTNTPPISIGFQQHDTAEVTNVVTIAAAGNYSFQLNKVVFHFKSHNVKDTAKVTVNSAVNGLFSRDNNDYDGWRNWNGYESGAVNAYQLANLYEFTQNTKATAISFVVAGGTTIGANTKVLLYEGWSRNLIGESDYHPITANEINEDESINPIEVSLPFTNGYPTLHKDSVYFAAVQAMGGTDSVWIAIGSINQQPSYTMYIFDTDNKWYYYSKGNKPSMIRLKTSTEAGIENNDNNAFALFQNTPNPANNSTKIAYEIKNASKVSISISDITGRVILNIDKGLQNSGYYSEEIDLSKFAAGTYFYTLKAGDSQKTKKMIVK